MKNWKFTCTDGFTKTVAAATQEEAVTALMADPEVVAHGAAHPELAGMLPEDLKAKMTSMVAEEVVAPASDMGGSVPPAGGDMGGGTPPPAAGTV